MPVFIHSNIIRYADAGTQSLTSESSQLTSGVISLLPVLSAGTL